MVSSKTGAQLERAKSRADERLFRHLGKVHGLHNRHLELLTALADAHELVRLSEIFLRPSLIDISPETKRWSEEDVTELRQRLTHGNDFEDQS